MSTITITGWGKKYVDDKIAETCKKVKIIDVKYDKKQFPLLEGDKGDVADLIVATIYFDGELW